MSSANKQQTEKKLKEALNKIMVNEIGNVSWVIMCHSWIINKQAE